MIFSVSLAFSCFFHASFMKLYKLGPPGTPRLAPKMAWLVYSTDCHLLIDHSLLGQITQFFLYNSCAFLLSFACFKTKLHILFWNPQTNQPVLIGWLVDFKACQPLSDYYNAEVSLLLLQAIIWFLVSILI